MASCPLHQAAAAGNDAEVVLALANGAKMDDFNNDGYTALMLAVWGGSEACVRELLKAGANTELSARGQHYTSLMLVNSVSTGKLLLQAGAIVNPPPTPGWKLTPLLYACDVNFNQDLEWVDTLLEAGADASVVDVLGRTPLTHVVSRASPRTIAALLKQGANPSHATNAGDFPLAGALTNSDEVVKLLLEAGADVHATNSDGTSVLTRAFSHGTLSMVRMLVEHGCDVNGVAQRAPPGCISHAYHALSTKEGCTALMHAVVHGKACPNLASKVRVLLEAGARADAVDATGETALHWLAKGAPESEGEPCTSGMDSCTDVHASQMDTVAMLVHAGTDINLLARTLYAAETALHYACVSNRGHIVKALLAAGADVNAVNGDGWTPLMRAAERKHCNICRLLLHAGAPVEYATPKGITALMYAAAYGAVEPMQTLLQAGAAIDAVDSAGRTAAFYAAQKARPKALWLLINQGTNIAHVECHGYSLLHVAVAYGHSYEVVKMLLDAGVQVNPPHVRMSPLMAAVRRDDVGMVALLLHAGANPHFVNQPGFTALRQSAANGAGVGISVLDMLLHAGACVNDVDDGTSGNVIAYTGGMVMPSVISRLMDAGTDISLIPADKMQIRGFVDTYLIRWHPRSEAQLHARWHRRHHAIRAWHRRHSLNGEEEEMEGPCGPHIDTDGSNAKCLMERADGEEFRLPQLGASVYSNGLQDSPGVPYRLL